MTLKGELMTKLLEQHFARVEARKILAEVDGQPLQKVRGALKRASGVLMKAGTVVKKQQR